MTSNALDTHFVARVEKVIADEIAKVAANFKDNGDGELAAELQKIYKRVSAMPQLKVPTLDRHSQKGVASAQDEKTWQRSDTTFYHPSQPDHAVLVLEVSYSQQEEDHQVLAERYIVGSSHATKAVLVLGIQNLASGSYQKPAVSEPVDQSAYLTLWRDVPQGSEEENEDGVSKTTSQVSLAQRSFFRFSDGSIDDLAVDLIAWDFLPSGTPSNRRLFLPPFIAVPFVRLRDALNQAEEACIEGLSD